MPQRVADRIAITPDMDSIPVCPGQQNKRALPITGRNELDLARQIGVHLNRGETPEVINGALHMVQPNINGCMSCLSTRIDLDDFEPDRSMRRALSGFDGRISTEAHFLSSPAEIAEHEALLRHHIMNRAPGRFYEGWAGVILSNEFAAFVPNSRRMTLAFRDAHDGRLVGATQVVRGLLNTFGRDRMVAYGASNYYDTGRHPSSSPGIAQICATIAWLKAQDAKYLFMGHTTLHDGPFHYKLRFAPELKAPEGQWQRCERMLEAVGNRKPCRWQAAHARPVA